MNENKETGSVDRRDETIDILVSPKKKEEPQAAPTAPQPSVSSAAPAEEKPREELCRAPAMPARRTSAADSDRTRAIRNSSGYAGERARETQATRVGGSVTVTDDKIGKLTQEKRTPKQEKPVPKKEKSKKETKERKKIRGFGLFSALRATVIRTVLYVAFVLVVSATLSYYGIHWANDVFAMVKEEVAATVTIPENATISEVADILSENGIIRYPSVFRLYIGYKNRDTHLDFKPGEYEVKSTLNYDQLVSLMKDRKSRSIVTITIPEGYTIDEIIDLFVSKGMGTREGFVEAINHFEYDYTFMEYLNQLELSDQRRYRLEGYLFPDTYEFYTDSKEVAIVDKMLAAFDYRFEKEYYSRLEELRMNLDEVITLASIVQMEGKFNSDFYSISGVFHNRMNSRDLKKLESDATIQYCLEKRKENLTYEDLAIDSPYNTRLYPGLPPSAIANPGWESIMATLYPEKNTFYYFVSDTDGSTIFAETLPEHLRNVAAVAAAKAAGGSVD